jgi:tryptophan-rich sensory protein
MTARDMRRAALALGCVLAVAAAGRLATAPHLAGWYAALDKPAFNPPNAIFAPMWGTLYILMVLALWRILRQAPARRTALALFFAQLAFNAAWPWMFFAANSPLLGLLNVVPQFLLVLAAAAAAWRVDRLAGLCLAPLAAWVGFALALNAAIWRLNP